MLVPFRLLCILVLVSYGLLGTSVAQQRPAEEEILIGISHAIQQACQTAIPKTVAIRIQRGPLYGFGSGAIISADGLILTCAHVAEASNNLVVITWDGKRYPAKKLGRNSKNDYALLQIKARNLPFFHLKRVRLRTKDWVIALGHPGGPYKGYQPGIAVGRIKALHKEFPILFAGKYYDDAIVSDLPIFGGNSGGPLINLDGTLIGINAAGMFTGDFAISVPATEIKRDVPRLRRGLNVSGRGGGSIIEMFFKLQQDPDLIDPSAITKLLKNTWLGRLLPMQQIQLPPQLGVELQAYEDGVLILGVKSGYPADLAGLQRGDLLVSINGRAVRTPDDVQSLVSRSSNYAKLKVVYQRRGKTYKMMVPLDRKYYARDRILRQGFRHLGQQVARSTVVLEEDGRIFGYGAIIDRQGLILTNERLVHGKLTVPLRLPDGEMTSAQVWGTNEYLDIALLKVEADEDVLVPFQWGAPKKLQAGDWVISGGRSSGPLAVGAVAHPRRSCRRRRMMPLIPQFWIIGRPNKSPLRLYPEVIQHDTNIEAYQFGSPLVDTQGRLVGINVAHFYPSSTFATPVDLIRQALPDLRAKKKIKAPLGYRPDPYQSRDPLADSIRKFLLGVTDNKGGFLGVEVRKYIHDQVEGVRIVRVLPHQAAARAGLQPNDVILVIDEEEIVEPRVLATVISRRAPGTVIHCQIWRQGQILQRKIKLGRRPVRRRH